MPEVLRLLIHHFEEPRTRALAVPRRAAASAGCDRPRASPTPRPREPLYETHSPLVRYLATLDLPLRGRYAARRFHAELVAAPRARARRSGVSADPRTARRGRGVGTEDRSRRHRLRAAPGDSSVRPPRGPRSPSSSGACAGCDAPPSLRRRCRSSSTSRTCRTASTRLMETGIRASSSRRSAGMDRLEWSEHFTALGKRCAARARAVTRSSLELVGAERRDPRVGSPMLGVARIEVVSP